MAGRRDDEDGYTLVEVLIAVALFGVLLAMAIPVVDTLFRTTVYVNNSYSNESQLLPIGTSFQSLIRSVVEPDPTLASGQPVPAYGLYTANNGTNNVTTTLTSSSATFFTNVGDTEWTGRGGRLALRFDLHHQGGPRERRQLPGGQHRLGVHLGNTARPS